MTPFVDPEKKKSFENIVGKGENAGQIRLDLFLYTILQHKNIIHDIDVTWYNDDYGDNIYIQRITQKRDSKSPNSIMVLILKILRYRKTC